MEIKKAGREKQTFSLEHKFGVKLYLNCLMEDSNEKKKKSGVVVGKKRDG